MSLIKCKECGGLVLKNGPLTDECQICHQQYEIYEYDDKTNFFQSNYKTIFNLFNHMKGSEIANIINTFIGLEELKKEVDMFYVQYEIEMTILEAISNVVIEEGENFGNYPYDSNTYNKFKNILSICRDLIYEISVKTGNKVDYIFIMSWFSMYTMNYINTAFNWAKDRWDRYDHEEDSSGWREYITILSYCQSIMMEFDKYGDVGIPYFYSRVIEFENIALDLTYIHRYWVGNYHASQQIGLNAESKKIWSDNKTQNEEKLRKVKNKGTEIEEKRKKELEAKLKAEKEARIKAFWEQNEELKEKLTKEKTQCVFDIKELEEKELNLPIKKEINDIKEEIKLANSILASYSFLDFKNKKNKKSEIQKLNDELSELKSKKMLQENEIKNQINCLNKRIQEIDNEFTIDRN